MADIKKGKKSSFKLKSIFVFFDKLFQNSKDASPVRDVSSAEEAGDEVVNCESVAQKEALIPCPTADDKSRPKENDNSTTSGKVFQEKDNKDFSRLVKREVDTQDNTTKTVKIQAERQSARTGVRDAKNTNRSKSVESVRSKKSTEELSSPRPCKFKTEDGRWVCEVCSWSSSDSTFSSFMNHCSSKDHREKIKNRFGSKQALGELHPSSSSGVKNKSRESKPNSHFVVLSEVNRNGKISVKSVPKQQTSTIQQEKSVICNSEMPRTGKMCKCQQAQNRVCQESSREEELIPKYKDLLKLGRSIDEPQKMSGGVHALSENKTHNDGRVNEVKSEVSAFKEKLIEIVKQEGMEVKKSGKKKKKKKTDEETISGINKKETESKVNTNEANSACKGAGGEGSGSNEDVPLISEMKKWISALGLIFIEPVSVSFLKCKFCDKLFPGGSTWEKFLINVGVHVEGKPHLKKVTQVLEASNTVVSLMKTVRKSPTGSLPNLSENNFQKKIVLK